MTTTNVESQMAEETALHAKASDFLRQAAHLSHEARLLKSVAIDAAEDGMYAAKRTIKKAAQCALDARDELTMRVKREPLKVLALALGVGAVLGLVFGWACRRTKGPGNVAP